MGHLDIFRFLVFISHYLAFPSESPWSFNSDLSDFPYPPSLLYLHSLFLRLIPESANLIPPHHPLPLGYFAIRIPTILTDFLMVTWLFRICLLKERFQAFWIYQTSAVLWFHQFYSGQFDLIVAFPAMLAYWSLIKGQRVLAFAGFSLSVILKPFAIIFYPMIALLLFASKMKWPIILFALLAPLMLLKVAELPFILDSTYRAKMGAGGGQLVTLGFLSGYGLLIAGILHKWATVDAIQRIPFFTLLVMLLMGAVAPHSAGWMTWALLSHLLLVLQDQYSGRIWLWVVWNFAFVLKWAVVSHSPVLDSLDVFLQNFTTLKTSFGMGYIYNKIAASSVRQADLLVLLSSSLFRVISALWLLDLIFKSLRPAKIYEVFRENLRLGIRKVKEI